MANPTVRKLRHGVWQYFDVESDGYSCSSCNGKKFVGRNTTNALKHLRMKHPAQFEQFGKKPAAADQHGKTQTLEMRWDKPPSVPSSPKCMEDKLCALIAMPNLSVNFFSSVEFVEFSKALNPRFKFPHSRTSLIGLLDGPYQNIKKKLLEALNASPGVSVTLDIWSGKCAKDSFIAGTVHYTHDGQLKSAFMGIMKLRGRHDAKNIKDTYISILDDIGISEKKVYRVVTDSGANIVCAFKGETGGTMELDNDSESDESDGWESNEEDFGNDDMKDVQFPKRLSCIAHTLQLTLSSGLKKSGCLKHVRALVSVIKKFRKTQIAAERLHEKTCLGLILPCPTRWNTLYYAIDRYIQIHGEVEKVAAEMHWNVRELVRYKSVYEGILLVMKPIRQHTDFLQGDKYVTISHVLPGLLAVKHELNAVKMHPESTVAQLAGCVSEEFEKRFSKVYDPRDQGFDPIYVISSVLDPNTAYLVEENFKYTVESVLWKMIHEEEIISQIEADSPGVEEISAELTDGVIRMTDISETTETCNGSAKFGQFGREILRKKRSLGESCTSDTLLSQISAHISEVFYQPPQGEVNAIQFWEHNTKVTREFRSVALRVLSVPASSAPVERVFSHAGNATSGKKIRTDQPLLNKKLFVHLNKSLLL